MNTAKAWGYLRPRKQRQRGQWLLTGKTVIDDPGHDDPYPHARVRVVWESDYRKLRRGFNIKMRHK